ncbi:CCA tRNA nucleotidyltransferase [Risungbinella massiliensis]|uniref:CCA tRNA nucleotidyltransferase n=1 Tax=Risungbinella massiliensis TaxID=1329796 RepID=UPI0005CC166D|nr:CCA tRNA nucleotidyltransferase [Risungbinella massiliensis]
MQDLRRAAEQVMEKLESAGYQAYMVGGCVRDLLLGRTPDDYDLATDAEPSVVEELFEKTIPTGIQHGTVIVINQEIPIEVTTFRVEGAYLDGRHPENVSFVKELSKDLSRRDFTINAMALDLRGKLYDYYQGQDDLEKKKIRAVGIPQDRFSEDALRMIRAIRFAAQLDFSIEPETFRAIKLCREGAKNLAVERVSAELTKLWKSNQPSVGLQEFWDTGLLFCTNPFAHWEKQPAPSLGELLRFDLYDDPALRWAYLLYLLQTPQSLLPLRLSDLKLSHKESVRILTASETGRAWTYRKDDMELRALLLQYGLEWTIRANQFANMIYQDEFLEQTEEINRNWHEMPVKMLKELPVKGSDLINRLQKPAGPWVGKTLTYLLEQVAFGELENQRPVLLDEGERYAFQCAD